MGAKSVFARESEQQQSGRTARGGEQPIVSLPRAAGSGLNSVHVSNTVSHQSRVPGVDRRLSKVRAGPWGRGLGAQGRMRMYPVAQLSSWCVEQCGCRRHDRSADFTLDSNIGDRCRPRRTRIKPVRDDSVPRAHKSRGFFGRGEKSTTLASIQQATLRRRLRDSCSVQQRPNLSAAALMLLR